MERILTESLSNIDQKFHTNELAYLALTSKIEQPLRDRWAFDLYQQFSGDLIVSREWRRTDIAILNKSEPKALIELKAMYTFDAALDKKGISGYFQKMEEDELKAKDLINRLKLGPTQIYTVLFVTHPKSLVSTEYENVIKYMLGINKAINTFNTCEEKVREVAIESINNKFKDKNVVTKGVLDGGEAFGISTDVLFWIVKA